MRFAMLSAALTAAALSQRPKIKDESGNYLISLEDVGNTCAKSSTGYAIVEGSLERCVDIASKPKGAKARAYEEYKCRTLRVHGEMKHGKCACQEGWKGPTCNYYEGCPDEMPTFHNKSCTKNGCAHDGIMAIGTKEMECICKEQWDGRRCDRLACWRVIEKVIDRRVRKGEYGMCECGKPYEGDDCSILNDCDRFGTIVNGMCLCSVGYGCHYMCGEEGCSGFNTTAQSSAPSPFFTNLIVFTLLASAMLY